MLPKSLCFPAGLATILTACAMPQAGIHRSSPIDHIVLRGEQLHTERQILEDQNVNLLSTFGNLVASNDRNLSLHLNSVLEAPEVNGIPLRLVRLQQLSTLLIAAYASQDGSERGALALIDVSNPEAPILRSELQFPSLRIETLAVDGRQVYFASGRTIGRISFQDYEWLDDLKIQTLELKSIQSLAVLQDRVVALDGSSSQLVALQKSDFSTLGQMTEPGLSQLAQDSGSIWTLTREPVQITQFDARLRKVSSIDAVGELGMRFSGQMQIGQETILAALGDGGVRSFCKADQRALFRVPAVIRAGLPVENTQCRGASLSEGWMLTANGDAGVFLYQVQTAEKQGPCKGRQIRLEGYLDLGTQFRAETLSWQHGVLSVGDDQGRLNLFTIDSDKLETDDSDFDG